MQHKGDKLVEYDKILQPIKIRPTEQQTNLAKIN